MSGTSENETKDAFDQVDVPVVVSPEMASNIADDLEENGRVSLEIQCGDAPNIIDQIRWQLENEKPALEFVEDYDGE